MSVRTLIIAAGLLAAPPAFAQGADPRATQNAANWEVFQKLYPARALAAREEGAVGFLVTLDKQGAVTNCEVTHSSGHPLLDQETCNLITLHALFKPDAGGSQSQVTTHEGVIAWKLPASTSLLAAPRPVSSAAAPEKVICKKTLRTGSLADYERICMTQREWATQSDETKLIWDDIQGRKGSSHGD